MGYLPCLEAVATREKEEAYSIEIATNGGGHGDKSVDIGGNNEEKTEAVQKAKDLPVQKEESNKLLASASLMEATIIATVAFQAACQVPGGYNGSGDPNLKEHNSLKRFMIFYSVSFGAFLSALNTQNSKPSDSAATGTYAALFLPSFP
nr:hypothetical protein CFP56_36890 [Quercus suber]